jgi:hypothetical protein
MMMETHISKLIECQVPVAHACNPSYLGGKDQEDRGSKPAQANSLGDPISKKKKKKNLHKNRAVESLKVKALSSSPSTIKKKKDRIQFKVL